MPLPRSQSSKSLPNASSLAPHGMSPLLLDNSSSVAGSRSTQSSSRIPAADDDERRGDGARRIAAYPALRGHLNWLPTLSSSDVGPHLASPGGHRLDDRERQSMLYEALEQPCNQRERERRISASSSRSSSIMSLSVSTPSASSEIVDYVSSRRSSPAPSSSGQHHPVIASPVSNPHLSFTPFRDHTQQRRGGYGDEEERRSDDERLRMKSSNPDGRPSSDPSTQTRRKAIFVIPEATRRIPGRR